jgi:hypothetical protein
VKALVAGWFSFEGSDATAGDLLACDLICEWLEDAGIVSEVARASPFAGGIDLADAEPAMYDLVVFVCGPFMRNPREIEFLGRFAGRPIVGVNVSLPVPLHEWAPFDLLFERDSSRRAHPDITFASRRPLVPVIGLCLVEPYDEAVVPLANAAVDRLIASREMAVVPIDTRLDVNATGLRTEREVESALARMDAVVTTRLHGTVLALKNGVPALVIDPEPGGGRIKRQADTIGWPKAFTVDALEDHVLQEALDFCLSAEARTQALACASRAAVAVAEIRQTFIDSVGRRARA